MNPSPWHLEVLGATSAEQVLAIVHDYLVLWRPDELAELPQPCDRARLATPEAVREYASAVSREQVRDPSRSPACQALTAFFAVAAMRLGELPVSADPHQAPAAAAA